MKQKLLNIFTSCVLLMLWTVPSLHAQNEWKSWVTQDQQTLRFWIDAESMRYYDKNKQFLFEALY